MRPSLAAFLSFVWPGFGQALNGQRRRAWVQAIPPLLVVAALIVLVLTIGPLVFGLHLLNPVVSLGLIGIIALLGLWRGYSIVDAARPRTPVATIVAVVLIAATVVSHAWLANNALAFYEAGQRISQPIVVALPPPGVTPEPTLSGTASAGRIGRPDTCRIAEHESAARLRPPRDRAARRRRQHPRRGARPDRHADRRLVRPGQPLAVDDQHAA